MHTLDRARDHWSKVKGTQTEKVFLEQLGYGLGKTESELRGFLESDQKDYEAWAGPYRSRIKELVGEDEGEKPDWMP